ncbi:hypothetical protein F5X99DRAFT_399520 [Biscogniauxia marginata]|nr:hypothetical protein F5X99DRAFT_399520 [Biscogniauxia marginata]
MSRLVQQSPARRTGMKRFRETSPDDGTPKLRHQLRLPATPASSSPFPTLRITKPRSGTERQASVKSHSMDQISSQFVGQGQKGSSRHMFPPTTMDQLTPYPPTRQQSHPNQSELGPTKERASTDGQKSTQHGEVPTVGVNKPETVTIIQDSEHTLPLDDDYPLDDLEDEAMSLLAIAQNCVNEAHMPPSSVTRAWDHDSRSAHEYDSSLQYSSPLPSESYQVELKKQVSAAKDSAPSDHDQDLLDEGVDWEAVFAATNILQRDPSIAPPQELRACQGATQETQIYDTIETLSPSDSLTSLSPFRRPPFPEKVHPRCSVPGMSSQTVLRTCFRIGVMINQTMRCFNHHQDVVFELFARVVYSNRENLSRTQHFQFVDLFKDQQPFPSGVLTGWKIGSELDRHSSAFLSTNAGPKLCWCLCKPVKDRKAAIGWTYIILSIKETNWDQIKWWKRVVCGEIEEQSEDVAAARL